MFDELYPDAADVALTAKVSRKPESQPPQRFSAWKMLGAAPKGVAAGAAEGTGSTADILGAFGQALATTGGSGKGMFATPTPEERKQTNEATDKLLKEGIDYNSEAGRLFRNVSADYTPDAQTAHVAESAVFNLFRVGSKALTSAATMGNIPGAVVAGLEEGFTQSDQLGQQGVDLATRTKVGAVTAVTNAVGFALPAAGKTWLQTGALALAGGPASFIAQNAATREILQAADYSKLADQYDPLDPVGLALSTLLPLGFGAWAMRRAKAKPGVEDKGPMPDGTSPAIKAPAPADTAQPATKGIANVQDAQAPAGTKAQATPDQAGTNSAGNATPPTDVAGTGAADVQANGVAPKHVPGAPLANGFFAGPVEGERFRVSDISATGGLTLDKRLKAGTASTMYVGVDGGFIDAANVNLIGDGASKIWKPITDAARNAAREILQEMGTLPLGNKRREELKAKLKEVVANDGTPPPDTVLPKAYHPPADLVDAARVNLVREHMDATNPKPGDLEATAAHAKAYKQAMEQQAAGERVSVDVPEPVAVRATEEMGARIEAMRAEVAAMADEMPPQIADFMAERGMVLADAVESAAPKGNAFIAWLKNQGGVAWAQKVDIVGERGVRGNYAGIFTKKGQNLDTLVESAVQAGYLTRADVDSANDVGGTRALSELIRRATTGEKIPTIENAQSSKMQDAQARANMDAADYMERELKALGVDTAAARGNVEVLAAYLDNHREALINRKLSDISADTAQERIDIGAAYRLEPHQIDEQSRIALANELDENAAYDAAMAARDQTDYLNRIEEIIRNAPRSRETPQSGTSPAPNRSLPQGDGQTIRANSDATTAKPADTGQPVSAGEASLDARLADISYRNPTALDAEIAVAFDENGKATKTMSAREYLDMVKQEAASDVKDASLFEVAANCFLSGGV